MSILSFSLYEIPHWVGIAVVVSFLLKVFNMLILPVLLKPLRKSTLNRYGQNSWAIITGASDGLGKGFAEELAKDGFNIILIARNKDKLDKAALSLKEFNPKIQTRVIVADFKEAHNRDFLKKELTELQSLDISMLVNNVGVDIINHFAEIPEEQLYDMISINVYSLVRITKILIPQLIKRNKKSAILNVGSVAGLRPMPYFAAYSATKAFTSFFTTALSIEYSHIDMLCLTPFYVSTQLTYRKKLGFDTLSPNECARGALGDLGLFRQTYGHWRHKIIGLSTELIPDFIFGPMTKKFGGNLEMERRQKAIEELAKKK